MNTKDKLCQKIMTIEDRILIQKDRLYKAQDEGDTKEVVRINSVICNLEGQATGIRIALNVFES